MEMLTFRPTWLLWVLDSIWSNSLECLGWFISFSLESTNPTPNMNPYSVLSPQPPQTQSSGKSLGFCRRLQLHWDKRPSRHALAVTKVMAADMKAFTTLTSLLPAEIKYRDQTYFLRKNLQIRIALKMYKLNYSVLEMWKYLHFI